MSSEVLQFPLPSIDRAGRADDGAEAYADAGPRPSGALLPRLAVALRTALALLAADAGALLVRLPDGSRHLAAAAGLDADARARLTAGGAGLDAALAAALDRRDPARARAAMAALLPDGDVLPILTPDGDRWGALVFRAGGAAPDADARRELARDFLDHLGWAVERDRRAGVVEQEVTAPAVRHADLAPGRAAAAAERLVERAERAERAERGERTLRAAVRDERLHAVGGALARVDAARLPETIVSECAAAAGAAAALLTRRLGGRRALEPIAASGAARALADGWAALPRDAALPPAEAVRTNALVTCDGDGACAERYPALDGWRRATGVASLAAAPVRVGGEVTAALLLAWARPRTLDADDRELLQGLAHLVGHALERTQLADTARAASAAKSDFLAMMSHELRTPLNAIMGYTSLVADEVVGPINDTQRDQLRRVQERARHLLGLIEEILTLSRAEMGGERLHPEPVNPAPLLHEVVESLAPSAARKGLQLDVVVDGDVRSAAMDADKVRQLLAHLLTNAVKFTPSGRVEASVREERAADDAGDAPERTIVFAVRDTGIGIAEEQQAHIFEPFWQAERAHARRAAGMGLGLNVTRRLADLLGGEIHVHSQLGQGSVFEFRLPVR